MVMIRMILSLYSVSQSPAQSKSKIRAQHGSECECVAVREVGARAVQETRRGATLHCLPAQHSHSNFHIQPVFKTSVSLSPLSSFSLA